MELQSYLAGQWADDFFSDCRKDLTEADNNLFPLFFTINTFLIEEILPYERLYATP